jgi:glycosyltransferase involved in cell wall biosynthesis
MNIAKMLDAFGNAGIHYRHIRLNFSDEINDMGKFHIKKLVRLTSIFFRLIWQLAVYRPSAVYYPPAGPTRTAVLRDIILLFPVKLFGFRRVFHFHAGGLCEMHEHLHPFLRRLYKFVYTRADHSICLSDSGRRDPLFLQSKHIHIIPTGVYDIGLMERRLQEKHVDVLFVGLCSESKGILDFIEVIREARKIHPRIRGRVVGKMASPKEQLAIEQAIRQEILVYEGVQTGDTLSGIFREADIFLFPSYFEAENFPTVILEAFSAGLPVLATRWRGITDQVVTGYNGFLHDVHDITGMVSSVITLTEDKALRMQMSANARHDFETRYRMGIFDQSIIHFFKSLE